MSLITRTICDQPEHCQVCYYERANAEHTGKPIKQISHDYISYGEYDNSCDVERANIRYLHDYHRTSLQIETGNYGSVQAWLTDTPKNRELLGALDSYPAFDDELVSAVASEIETEYLTGNDDIYRLYTPEPLKTILEALDLTEIDRDCYYATEPDFKVQAGGIGYVDLKKIAPQYLEALKIKYPAINLLVPLYSRPAFPLSFYQSAQDLLDHIHTTSRGPLTAEEAAALLTYTAELESLLPERAL